ncbi:MAG: GDSL-type esterase/lipase family protein [Acidobacteriota bacterium]
MSPRPICRRPRRPVGFLLVLCLACALLISAPAEAQQTRYLAFGDSITEGFADTSDTPGYPPKLENILEARGVNAEVANFGLGGETTAEGVTRVDEALATGGDVLLLMEGTNDINQRLSPETVRFNLDRIADKAEAQGLEVILATIIPRLPSANFDGSNRITGQLGNEIRSLAFEEGRELADPFQALISDPDAFSELYAGGTDRIHLNTDGYQEVAEVWANVITDLDDVPPVVGAFSPEDDQQAVPNTTPVDLEVFDFGAGLDTTFTELLINGEPVPAEISGNSGRQALRYIPQEPWVGVVFIGLRARDLASPVNTFDGNVGQFVTEGTQFVTGDIDRDGRVDGVDLGLFGVRFGSVQGDGRYRNFADLDGSGVVDGTDLAILAENFGASAF